MADAEIPAADFFLEGQNDYDAGEFIQAMPSLQRAVELEPLNSEYQHLLGKCYGRIAEHGSWFTALRYVKRTLQQFKKAVELDPENYQAWRDLEEFYRRAPGFLGGDSKRASEIREMLDKNGNHPPEAGPTEHGNSSAS